MESVYADGYTNFGWILEGASYAQGTSQVNLKFKRDRKIPNKPESTRLQRQFEACVLEIENMESSKVRSATALACAIGVIGTAFMAGFAIVVDYPAAASVVLAIPGLAGWILAYPCYCMIKKKKTNEVQPFIDGKYDEIYEACENAHHLLPAEGHDRENMTND